MQRAGLEWIHRALSEPRRLIGRYAHDLVVFGPALGRQMWSGRRRRRRGVVLTHGAAMSGGACVVELAGLRRLDNAATADVVAAQRSAHLAGATVTVEGVSAVVLDDARRLGVASFVAGEQSRPEP
jgi:ABC-type transporter Mla MlaB component